MFNVCKQKDEGKTIIKKYNKCHYTSQPKILPSGAIMIPIHWKINILVTSSSVDKLLIMLTMFKTYPATKAIHNNTINSPIKVKELRLLELITFISYPLKT